MLAQPQETDQLAAMSLRAYEQALGGDFARAADLAAALGKHRSPLLRAWSLVLRGQHWHGEPEVGELPSLADCEAFVDCDEAVRAIAVVASAQAVKRAVIAHDLAELRRWTSLQDRLVDAVQDPRACVWADLCQAWLALAEGRAQEADTLAERSAEVATHNTIADALIEATVVRAHALAALGSLAEATSSARSATRMARTEDFPQSQYLAGLALARVRRLNGMAHLATRILRPMLSVLPVHWHSWLVWEALMAGATGLVKPISLTTANDPTGEVRLFRAAIGAAQDGDLDTLCASFTDLQESPQLWHLRSRDVRLAYGVLNPVVAPDARDETLVAWLNGAVASPPNEIKGFCIGVAPDEGEPSPAAFVVAGPTGDHGFVTPRRIACMSEPLFAQYAHIEQIKGKFERTVTAIAAIALAGPAGIESDALFQSVYGFSYNSELHRTPLNTLRHRAKQTVSPHGMLTFEDGRHTLTFNEIVVIPDPRCGQSLEESALRVFARLGAAGAKDAAERLGVPLRTLQKSLKVLVEDGALNIDRKGREVRYSVEDTTFSEPTKWSAQLPSGTSDD